MKDFTEKRDRERCQLEVPVSCGYFNSDYFYPAKMKNHSIKGLCLTLDFFLSREVVSTLESTIP
jgi:hypothetical protein